jgi:hypothetical protein
MEPIQTYLTNQTILDDDANIKWISRKAMSYTMVDGIL